MSERAKSPCPWLAPAVACVLLAAFATAAPVTPVEAERFVDSIGVNIQLGGGSTGYANHAKVKANLIALGVRHVRNPLWGNPPPYASFNDLTSAGIRLIVPTGYNHDGKGADALVSQLRNIPYAVEGVEGVNEPDIFAPQVTPAQLVAYQQAVHTKIKADPVLNGVPVLAPSMGNPYTNNIGQQLTDLGVGQYADIANSHAYPSVWMPENHSWVTNMINWANTITPGKAQVMTETGYGYGNPDSTAGVHTPRLLLDLFCVRGLRRSYIYQLCDIGDGFDGLYQSNATTINAQGRSVRNLIAVMHDGYDWTPAPLAPLDYTLSGDTSSLRSQLFEQRDGDYLLALWRATDATTTATPNMTLKLNGAKVPTGVTVFSNLDSASFDAAGAALPFTANDEVIAVGCRVVIVKFTGLASPPVAGIREFRLYD